MGKIKLELNLQWSDRNQIKTRTKNIPWTIITLGNRMMWEVLYRWSSHNNTKFPNIKIIQTRSSIMVVNFWSTSKIAKEHLRSEIYTNSHYVYMLLT